MKNKRLLKVMYVITVIIVMTSCTNKNNQNSNQSMNVQNSTTNEWKSISPERIKNAITLFDKDWMALAAGKEGDMNAMTISWGEMGELWNHPVITVYVSSSRYTYKFMERNDYFTVSAFPEKYREALSYIGSHSGRDGDKLKAAGLTPEFTKLGNPIFKEANLAIECKMLYSTPFDSTRFKYDIKKFYTDKGMGIHTMYIGEIVNVWTK